MNRYTNAQKCCTIRSAIIVFITSIAIEKRQHTNYHLQLFIRGHAVSA